MNGTKHSELSWRRISFRLGLPTEHSGFSEVREQRPPATEAKRSTRECPALKSERLVAIKASISAVSYNIHQCVGFDGRRDAARIARILNELKADIIGLQEVHSADGTAESRQTQFLAEATGLEPVAGLTVLKSNSEYGNVLLSRYPVTDIRLLDLSVPGREPRGAIDARIEVNDKVVRVIVSHLGLGAAERRYQVNRLRGALDDDDSAPVILIMDHNEWLPLRQSLRLLHDRLGKPPTLGTFPSIFPVLPHDRVWVSPIRALVHVRRYATALTRIASDHLPLVATIDTNKLFSSRLHSVVTADEDIPFSR